MIRALWSRVKRRLADNSNDRAACPKASIGPKEDTAAGVQPGPLAPELLPAAPVAPDWDPKHQGELAKFLASEAGIVFLERFRAVEFETCGKACHDAFHTVHSAGRAAGFSDALQWVLSLSRASRASEASSPDGTTGQPGREQDSEFNTQELGEASLRERMSP